MIASVEVINIKRLSSSLSYPSYIRPNTSAHKKPFKLVIKQLHKILGLRHHRYRFIVPLVDLIGKLRSGDDTKTAINRLCRTITFMDVIDSSIGSIFCGSSHQITAAQHASISNMGVRMPAAFVAAENLMKPCYRVP